MHLQLETILTCDFERAVEEAQKPRLLSFVAHPLVGFEPVDGATLPTRWGDDTYWFRLKLFGFIPMGNQAVRATIQETADELIIQDNGYSRLIRRWDHRINIERRGGGTLYRDTLDLDAGVLTPLVWLFARVFFSHRQKRWRQLAQSGFEYGDS